jgi:hypothetical protein
VEVVTRSGKMKRNLEMEAREVRNYVCDGKIERTVQAVHTLIDMIDQA